jgi:DNA repair exonuclease SbcCD ATPase subunit
MTCPACDAHLSSVYSAFREERPCPECGLPHDAAVAVLKAAARGASEDLQRRYAEAEQRAAQAEREANALRNKIRAIEAEVNRSVEQFDPGVWDD